MTSAHDARAAQTINAVARKRMAARGQSMNELATPARSAGLELFEQLGGEMPIMFRLYLDPRIRGAIKDLAIEMASDTVFTPQHLRDKPAACAVVISKAIAWNMHPDDVADGTYQPTEGGPIAYKSKVINAAIAVHFDGGIQYKHFGDWSRVHNKFKNETSPKGRKYQVPTWTEKDAEGLGVEVIGKLKGEREPRRLRLELAQCWPRFSTLWATDPQTQICYTALRRFTSVVAPAALMSLRLPGLDDSSEIDMGTADIVPPEIQMPQPKEAPQQQQAETKAETIDTDTGEVSKSAPAGEAPSLVTPGALGVIRQRLADKELSEAFCKHFAIADASELPRGKTNEALAWIDQQKK